MLLRRCRSSQSSRSVAVAAMIPPPIPRPSPPPVASTLTKEQFIQQGDGICAEVNAAVGTIESSSTDQAAKLTQEADLYSGMMDRLEGLGTPKDSAGLDAVLSAGDDLVQAQKDAQLAAERGDDASLTSAESDAASALSSFQDAAEVVRLRGVRPGCSGSPGHRYYSGHHHPGHSRHARDDDPDDSRRPRGARARAGTSSFARPAAAPPEARAAAAPPEGRAAVAAAASARASEPLTVPSPGVGRFSATYRPQSAQPPRSGVAMSEPSVPLRGQAAADSAQAP